MTATVMQVVTTTTLLLLVVSLSAATPTTTSSSSSSSSSSSHPQEKKPTTIDEISVNTKDQGRRDSRFFPQPMAQVEIPPENQTKEAIGEIALNEHSNLQVTHPSNDYLFEATDGMSTRRKRKVIFGGGSYGHGGRRGGGSGGDPYGRRRDHYEPGGGPHDSWPYRQPDMPYVETPIQGATSSTPARGTSQTRPTNSGSTSSSVGGRRAKTGKKGNAKKKMTRNVKWEIAKFALKHGTQTAKDRFEGIVGRKLPLKKIQKFIKRYQKHQEQN